MEMKKGDWLRQKKSAIQRLHEYGGLHRLQHRVPADVRSELYQICNRVSALRDFKASNLTLFIDWASLHLFTDLFLCLLSLKGQVTGVTWIC